ncbi:MAG TPA: hypothetical protein VF198_17405 [Vicinamibacterales bacterium]
MPPPQPSKPSQRQPPDREQLEAWRQIVEGKKERSGLRRTGGKLLTGGLVGLAAMGLAGWAWTRKEDSGERSEPAEPRKPGKPPEP